MQQEHCVLIHGFTGNPGELAPLTAALQAAGYRTTTPTLAGHDGTFHGLIGVTADHWIASAAEPAANALREGPVHIIGFSMGALIAAVIASKHPVASVTMLAPAIHYVRPDLLLRQASVFAKGRLQPESEEAKYLQQRPSGFLMTPPSSLLQLHNVVQQAKQALPNIRVPVCIIQGDRDEIAHPKSSQYVHDHVQSGHCQLIRLPRSRHHVCLDVESDVAIQSVVDFLDSDAVQSVPLG